MLMWWLFSAAVCQQREAKRCTSDSSHCLRGSDSPTPAATSNTSLRGLSHCMSVVVFIHWFFISALVSTVPRWFLEEPSALFSGIKPLVQLIWSRHVKRRCLKGSLKVPQRFLEIFWSAWQSQISDLAHIYEKLWIWSHQEFLCASFRRSDFWTSLEFYITVFWYQKNFKDKEQKPVNKVNT